MFEFSQKKLLLINYFLMLFLMAAILLSAKEMIRRSLTEKARPSGTRSNIQEQTLSSRKNLMQYSAILEKNPFGPPAKLIPATAPQEQDTEKQDVSIASLVLLGTTTGPGSLSYAVLEDRSQSPAQQDLFALGENVFSYGRLRKIESSAIEIEGNTARHTIMMQELASLPVEIPAQGKDASFAKKIGEREYVLDSRKIQKSLENPEQILTDARLLPNIVNGKQEGFSISEVVPGGIYQSLGLKNGDVLLKINGLVMSSPEAAIQTLSALKGMNNINLDIIRGGQNMSMNYRIK